MVFKKAFVTSQASKDLRWNLGQSCALCPPNRLASDFFTGLVMERKSRDYLFRDFLGLALSFSCTLHQILLPLFRGLRLPTTEDSNSKTAKFFRINQHVMQKTDSKLKYVLFRNVWLAETLPFTGPLTVFQGAKIISEDFAKTSTP